MKKFIPLNKKELKVIVGGNDKPIICPFEEGFCPDPKCVVHYVQLASPHPED